VKLPFAKNTAAALEKAKAALTAAEGKAAALTAEREALLLAEDGFDRLWSVDKQIAEAAAQAQTRRDQIAALEAAQVEEQRQIRQKDYEAAVDRVAAMLPRRAKAAADFEAAAKAVGDALQKLHATEQAILRDWPANLPRPWLSSMDVGRAERVLANGFGVFAGVNRRWGWSFSEKVQRLGAEIAGFAAGEARHHDELIADLRAQPAPEPPAPESDEAEEIAA